MPRDVTIATYVNKKGEDRVNIMVPRVFAIRLALGDEEALAKLIGSLSNRLERQEQASEMLP
jgi:hypothetical protein